MAMFRLFLAIPATLLPFSFALASTVTVPQCSKPDASFKNFLERFESDAVFRETRLEIPFVARSGDGISSRAEVALWSLADIRALKNPLIYPAAERERLRLNETVLALRGDHAEVFQANSGEADDVRLYYRFRKFNGCWALEEFSDLGQ
jgi:hypothetical protein